MDDFSFPNINSLPQFERLVHPVCSDEAEYIRSEVISRPEARVVHTWHGNHLFDKARFEICIESQITPTIEEVFFDDWLNAAIFICQNELKNPHITDDYKKYLIGQYLHYKLLIKEKANNHGQKYITAGELAQEIFVSAGTVMKYGVYAEAMNFVFDQSLEFGQDILTGKYKVSHENVIELSHLKPEEIKTLAAAAERDNVDHLTLAYIRNEVKWSYVQSRAPVSRREKSEKKMSHPAIRQMPMYDPDSEVNSLCMTIDFWISSIQRVSSSENFNKITSKASLQLMKKLSFLEHTVNSVQEMLVERTN